MRCTGDKRLTKAFNAIRVQLLIIILYVHELWLSHVYCVY
jgi:hypothetical protein